MKGIRDHPQIGTEGFKILKKNKAQNVQKDSREENAFPDMPVITNDPEANEIIQDTHPGKQRQALPAEDPIEKDACSKQ
jgi:hypothetical protein